MKIFQAFPSFHGYSSQIFRYGLSKRTYNLYSCSSHNTISVESMEEEPKKTTGSSREIIKVQSLDQKPNQNSWIQKWSETHHQNPQRRPQTVIDYKESVVSSEEDSDGSSEDCGSDWNGERSRALETIVGKLKRFGYVDEVREGYERRPERGSVDDIFYVEPGVLPNSRGGFSVGSPFEGRDGEVGFVWEKLSMEKEVRQRRRRTCLVESNFSDSELQRLMGLGIGMKERTKIGNAGVTHEIVDVIQEKWKKSEVVKIKCEGNAALNMKRTHEILERKTGGLVIWRSGSSVLLYRGGNHHLHSAQSVRPRNENVHRSGVNKITEIARENGSDNDMKSESLAEVIKDNESTEIKYEHEVDRLLEGLGPRFMDWPGCGPLPVDADLLPGVVPGYKPPFRILPYGIRCSLGNMDITSLRRLARVLSPHFALGRSRQHQGLAVAMVNLWERSFVVKIAFKRGVQLTSSERMAEEIKNLTGGTIVSRNKDFIVFYRGKDFLSPAVTEALLERVRLAKALQEEEEQVRLRTSSLAVSNVVTNNEIGTVGTLGEMLEADACWRKKLDNEDRDKMMRSAKVARHAALVKKLEQKLELAEGKVMRAEKALAKVEEFLKPKECSTGQETISDEERLMFRKLGLRMKSFLLMGRPRVFDGTVESMHFYWKYRELVKVIVKDKNLVQARNIALSLEAESGGILVSVDKVSKGYTMVVFRGKYYRRPPVLRPKNLLTKRKALARSIELQRLEALNNHISTLERTAARLSSELVQMETVEEHGNEDFYAKLDSAYFTEDEDTEDSNS